uniref:Uncharacterized protein n=1 Tax=Hyaloperonospora arabidopsidis (strain Emoy2) TaxID=559515 RepID=M4C6J6_HYAAE
MYYCTIDIRRNRHMACDCVHQYQLGPERSFLVVTPLFGAIQNFIYEHDWLCAELRYRPPSVTDKPFMITLGQPRYHKHTCDDVFSATSWKVLKGTNADLSNRSTTYNSGLGFFWSSTSEMPACPTNSSKPKSCLQQKQTIRRADTGLRLKASQPAFRGNESSGAGVRDRTTRSARAPFCMFITYFGGKQTTWATKFNASEQIKRAADIDSQLPCFGRLNNASARILDREA